MLSYSRDLSPDPFILQFQGHEQFGPAQFDLAGRLRVSPTLRYSATFGLDLLSGPFLVEGASVEVGVPVSGQLSGKAHIGDLVQVDAVVDAVLRTSGRVTLS